MSSAYPRNATTWFTGEPCELKGSSTVRRGACGKAGYAARRLPTLYADWRDRFLLELFGEWPSCWLTPRQPVKQALGTLFSHGKGLDELSKKCIFVVDTKGDTLCSQKFRNGAIVLP